MVANAATRDWFPVVLTMGAMIAGLLGYIAGSIHQGSVDQAAVLELRKHHELDNDTVISSMEASFKAAADERATLAAQQTEALVKIGRIEGKLQ